MAKTTIIITPLLKAKETLDSALATAKPGDTLERDGCIQRFEYCYELAWKMMKRFLKEKGVEVHGPKDTFRQAAAAGYIEDPEVWFRFIEMRNLTVHTYNAEVAKTIFEGLKPFQAELHKLVEKLQSL